jgi:hypothetical protein
MVRFEAELAVSRAWRNAIDCRVACDESRGFAEHLTSQLQLYVRD